MAPIVAPSVPHTPRPVGGRARDDLTNEAARLFAGLADRLREARANTIVLFDSDHLNTFFSRSVARRCSFTRLRCWAAST